jgi:hypothetical protein
LVCEQAFENVDYIIQGDKAWNNYFTGSRLLRLKKRGGDLAKMIAYILTQHSQKGIKKLQKRVTALGVSRF